jgi:anionic cell wall polymer biosynthesis LytR-Cps2A-Psr (LCP) family protein
MKFNYNKNKFITILFSFLLLVLLVIYYYPRLYFFSNKLYDRYFTQNSIRNIIDNKGRVNILFFSEDFLFASKKLNSLYLVSFEPVTEQLGIVFIPPNTKFSIENGSAPVDPVDLNEIYIEQGIRNLKLRLEEQLNITIPFYISFKEGHFEKFINFLGGVNINVLFPIKSINQKSGRYYLLNTGEQILFGPKTIEFVTFIDESDVEKVDIVYRQQTFFKTLIEKINNEKDLLLNDNSVNLIYSFLDKNNIRRTDLREIINILIYLKTYNIQMAKLPGEISKYDENEFLTPDVMGVQNILPMSYYQRIEQDEVEERILVRIINATGISGLASRLRLTFVEYYDIDVLELGNQSTVAEYTIIKNFKGNYRSALRLREVLRTGKIVEEPRPQNLVDIEIIIGKDYEEYLELE